MNKPFLKRLGLKLALLIALVLPEVAGAQSAVFTYNGGDVLAGFRKASAKAGLYELVVDLGSVTNFLTVPAGQAITITNFTTAQLTNAFTDTSAQFGYIQWSVFAACPTAFPSSWSTGLGTFPYDTLWLTLPGTNVNTQTTPPSRQSYSFQQNIVGEMNGVGTSAATISSGLSASTNNTTMLVREPRSGNSAAILTAYIGDATGVYTTDYGDFGGNQNPLPYTVENVAPSTFTTAMRSDFYQLCPSGKVDPITGQTSGSTYFVGYFILNPNGSMTFTRASTSPAAPVTGSVTSSVTNGLAPLSVVFTNTGSSNGTNWIWSFGDGNSVTNTTSANVTNTYAAAGSYTVSLTVNGAGGSSTNILSNYIVVTNAVSVPVAGFTGTPTNGFIPLKVVFTNLSTGSFTNSVWNFGNGTSFTNLTGGNVTNTYAAAGTNTVTLVVNGTGGSSTNKLLNYITALPAPVLSFTNLVSANGKLVFNCPNSPAGVQYRILSSTNLTLPVASWTPVFTNTFPNPYTNSALTNAGAFFRLVSP